MPISSSLHQGPLRPSNTLQRRPSQLISQLGDAADMGADKGLAAFNSRFERSWVGKYFDVANRRTTLLTEIRAGCVTFLTLAYILAVNSSIISDSGGICSSDDCTGPDKSFECRFTDPGYKACVDTTRKSLITSTALASLVGSAVMGIGANLPIGLAPGMGLNAYFTYNVVGYYGTGSVSYKDALTAVFIEGIIFVILSVTGVRQFLIKLLPRTLSLSMAIGIGLFLAIIGFQESEGLGVVTADGATLVTLGGCDTDYRVNPYYISTADMSTVCDASLGSPIPNLPAPGANYQCVGGHKMKSPAMWLGLAGLAIMVVLMSRGAKGAIIIGIAFTTFISWIPGHGASYLGNTSDLPGGIGNDGDSRWSYFRKVVAAPSLTNVAGQFDFGGLGTGDVWKALIIFLYVDFFDTSGTLLSMATFIGNFIPNFVGEDKSFPRSIWAYCSDGISISVGACFGTSPCTAFIESATGIKEGGRTGITALTVAFCMFVSMFFAPLIASIPVFATGPALILVGALMMVNATKIPWNDITHAVPAFLTIAVMPFTYSIAYGVIAGIVSYFICWVCKLGLNWVSDKTGGRLGGHHTVHEDIDHLKAREAQAIAHKDDSAHAAPYVPDPKISPSSDPKLEMSIGGGPPTAQV